MSHGQGRYQPGQQYPPNMGHQMPQQPYQHHAQMGDLTYGMKNMGVGQRPGPGQPNNNMLMQNVYHPADTNRAAALNQGNRPVSQMDFLQALGGGFSVGPRVPTAHVHGGSSSPGQNTMASAVAPQRPPIMHPRMPAQPPPAQRVAPQHQSPIQQMPHSPIQQMPQQHSSTNLSVAASEFVPGFRKPEKSIILYTPEGFKKKSRADDEMAINDVKKKLVQLQRTPQDVETVMESAVDTIKNWTTSVNTYHQIVEDVFEFSVDEENHPNFHIIGSKIISFLTLKVQPYSGNPPLTFFDTVVHKCCREFDNCMRLDHRIPAAQERIKNIALMIAELFHTIKEGELRVFLFAEQVTSLCLLLVQIRTILAFETVAKIFLVCGKSLKALVDEMRFNCIMQHLQASTKFELDGKTRSMVENVLLLNEGGWQIREEEQAPSNSNTKSWSGRDDCCPVNNASEWDDYATDDYDEEWLTQMLKFEEEDDFSDVEEDFKRFMEEAQRYKS